MRARLVMSLEQTKEPGIQLDAAGTRLEKTFTSLSPLHRCLICFPRSINYSFMPILLKHHICFGLGLKICTWFVYIIFRLFLSLFSQVELVIFQSLVHR